jgi:peptidoglycan hydrolase-like protein with peptidoglycan-binding domain
MAERIYFSQGLQGSIASLIQTGLFDAGFGEGTRQAFIDGDYGGMTAGAMRRFRQSAGLDLAEGVDQLAWSRLTTQPLPALFTRCLSLTAAFEGHGFSKLEGNFDGAGLTFGIIGFTLKHGELQQLVSQAFAEDPALGGRCFSAAQLAEWAQVTQRSLAGQVAWAGDLGARLSEWKDSFARFGSEPRVQALQVERAARRYFEPARESAARMGLTTEQGIALAFDTHVQNGGFKEEARRLAQQSQDLPESRLRELLADAVASSAAPQWQEDVRNRKRTIATGAGSVHGRAYRLTAWGLDEFLAT